LYIVYVILYIGLSIVMHVDCLPHNAMHNADYAIARCLSIFLSATRQYSVKTTKNILKLYTIG